MMGPGREQSAESTSKVGKGLATSSPRAQKTRRQRSKSSVAPPPESAMQSGPTPWSAAIRAARSAAPRG